MSLFTSTSSQEFAQKVSTFNGLITEEKLEMSDVIKKKQYIQICSLKLDQSNHKYDDLSKILNVISSYISSHTIDQERRG